MKFACSAPAKRLRINYIVPCEGDDRPADFYGVQGIAAAYSVAVQFRGFGFWRVKWKAA